MVPSRKLCAVRTGFCPSVDALAINGEAAAIDLQRCFRPAELKPAIVDGGIHHALVHHIKAGIAERRLNRVGTIPLLENIFVAEHLRLARLVGFHGPVHHIDPVREQIGHGAAAKIPEPAPVIEFFLAEWLIGSGSEPKLPIERLLVDGLRRPVPVIVLPPIGSHLHDAPETACLESNRPHRENESNCAAACRTAESACWNEPRA